MNTQLSQIGEFALIRLIQKKAPRTRGVVQGIGDDAAVVSFREGRGASSLVLLTTDMMAEGVHFTRRMPARSIGHKALACNLSDIAAMGGVPRFAVVSLGVPADLRIRFVEEMYDGINRLAKRFSVAIVGGDTIRCPKITINVALLGEVKRKELVTRAGARKKDRIFVTGALGRSFKTGKHLSFIPRIAESRFLVGSFQPTAMIDISDGLIADLAHILEASRAGACLYEEKIPRTPQASLAEALGDGEDFELLFTLPYPQGERLRKIRNKRFTFYPIGEIVDQKEGIQLVDRRGHRRNLRVRGFEHF